MNASAGLLDRYGRRAVDLRVSLTDRCNLRCTYCMPPEGLPWLPNSDVLTDDEVIRLITIAVTRLGVEEVRFTGGEPLLRPGLTKIVAASAALLPRPTLSLTTNGIGLDRLAAPLKQAGLDRVNVSLDTLDEERFNTIAHRRRLPDVLRGLEKSAEVGFAPVKINTVLLRGVNDDEAPALLRFALEHGYELRFIEQMPLDAQHGWSRSEMITAAEILATLEAEFDLSPDPTERGGAPAETWLVNGGPARVGVIGSVTRPFCGDCDRTRLTADGQVRNCLFATGETDLRGLLRGTPEPSPSDAPGGSAAREGRVALPLVAAQAGAAAAALLPSADGGAAAVGGQRRGDHDGAAEVVKRPGGGGEAGAGASDEEVAQRWREAMWGKLPGHGIDNPAFLQPARPMSAIGG